MQDNPTTEKPVFDEKAYMKAYAAKNREKIAAYQKQWREKNRERLLQYSKSYYAENRDRLSKDAKQRYAANPEPYKRRAADRYAEKAEEIKSYVAQWQKANPEKRRAYKSRWSRDNPEKVRANCKLFRDRHPEYHKARLKKWNAENRDKVLAYREANKDRIAERGRIWHQENPDRARMTQARRRARMMGNGGTFTENDIAVLYDEQIGLCAGCHRELNGKFEIDHVMPILLGGSNWPENLQLLCRRCNRSKGHKHPDAWLAELRSKKP
jgi:5-methylcytosine-specific restriction endonuclease McrA